MFLARRIHRTYDKIMDCLKKFDEDFESYDLFLSQPLAFLYQAITLNETSIPVPANMLENTMGIHYIVLYRRVKEVYWFCHLFCILMERNDVINLVVVLSLFSVFSVLPFFITCSDTLRFLDRIQHPLYSSFDAFLMFVDTIYLFLFPSFKGYPF